MEYRVVWLSGIVVGTAAVASSSCYAPDPGEVTFSERPRTESSSGVASSGGPSSSSSSGGSSGGDGGSSSGGEAGAPDPVFGMSAFAPGNPGQNANGASATHPGGTVEGVNCFTAGCHLDTGPKWGFAGTVYETINGGATVKNAEVRVSDAQGKLFASVYTDDNGNFWYEGAKPPANARAGVRNATAKMNMVAVVAGEAGGACNSAACHGGAAMRIYLK